MVHQHQTRNLEIPGSVLADRPGTTRSKKTRRHSRRRAFLACRRGWRPSLDAMPFQLLDERIARGARYPTISAVTWPRPPRPMARAAPVERSSTRPRTNGPRSLTVTTTLRPPWLTRSLVPNGSERWARVMALEIMRAPEAVRLPDSLP